jgi:outer membrane lipoprotein-sorting protein
MHILITLILSIALSLPGLAQNRNADFAVKLKEHYKTVKSISAQFTQRKQSLLFDTPLVSEGLFYFQKPDKIRWEQQKPKAEYFVINGDAVIQFDGESVKKSAGLDMQMSVFRQFILGTVDGSILDDASFEKTFLSKNGKMTITLLPTDKRMAKRLQRIELTFDERSLLLDQLKMYESPDEYSDIRFTGQKINAEIPSSIFQ